MQCLWRWWGTSMVGMKPLICVHPLHSVSSNSAFQHYQEGNPLSPMGQRSSCSSRHMMDRRYGECLPGLSTPHKINQLAWTSNPSTGLLRTVVTNGNTPPPLGPRACVYTRVMLVSHLQKLKLPPILTLLTISFLVSRTLVITAWSSWH